MKPFPNAEVAEVFQSYPEDIRNHLLFLRQLIFETAEKTEGVGEVQETLKWGKPAYLTKKSEIGSTIRIAWKKPHKDQYAMYFPCKARLIEIFKTLFPKELTYEGNRILFDKNDSVPVKALQFCIAEALTYYLGKKPRVLR